MMISKRVNANAPTLERSPRFARLRSFVYKYKYNIAFTTLVIAVTTLAKALSVIVCHFLSFSSVCSHFILF